MGGAAAAAAAVGVQLQREGGGSARKAAQHAQRSQHNGWVRGSQEGCQAFVGVEEVDRGAVFQDGCEGGQEGEHLQRGVGMCRIKHES